MDRQQLQALAELRVQEARVLLDAGYHAGAYYLVGYAVECALKACVAKQVKQYEFPDKKLANDAFTHDLERLMRVAGLTPELEEEIRADALFNLKWTLVKDWSESARYDIAITSARAQDLFAACTAKDGILPWVKKRW